MTEAERLALVAHELRSPVAALAGLAERARAMSPADLARATELAVSAGRDIERLLSDPDLLSLRLERVELGQLLDPLARPRVTCSAEPATLVCDPTRIRQALGNLVGNGLRHGTLVTVTGQSSGDGVLIDVADDGPGLALGEAAFERGVSGAGSSGYGLWLARAIARAHGGELEAVAAPAGALFRLSLPLSGDASG
jgi:signal transduction histidine kinase